MNNQGLQSILAREGVIEEVLLSLRRWRSLAHNNYVSHEQSNNWRGLLSKLKSLSLIFVPRDPDCRNVLLVTPLRKKMKC